MLNEMSSTKTYSTTKSSALNNNLSELDTLLQDLSNARYSGGTTTTTMERVSGKYSLVLQNDKSL